MENEAPLRRMRVRLLPWHNPPVWEASYEPPGKFNCYCHAPTLLDMMQELEKYFRGRPQRVAPHMMPYVRSVRNGVAR